MTASEVKDIIINNKGTIAFVIGNGINRSSYKSSSYLSWEELLEQVWKKHSSSIITLSSTIPADISYTEYIDAVEIELLRKGTTNLIVIKKEIADLLFKWPASIDINTIISKIEALNVPILTPNYDNLLEQAFPVTKRILKISKKSTDFYPWNYYYGQKGKKILSSPIGGFGIWHFHGMIEHPRSIRIGLNDYMGLVERSRNMIQNHYLDIKDTIKPTNTWFDIIFQKSLFIVGFGLDKDEVFFRWLLLQRAKYQVVNKASLNGWYISFKNNPISSGQRTFLTSIGFNVIDMDDYKDFYKDVWNLI